MHELVIVIIILLTGLSLWLYLRYLHFRRKALFYLIQRTVFQHSLDLHTFLNSFNKLAAVIMLNEKQYAYNFLIDLSKIIKNRLLFEPPLTWSLLREIQYILTYQEANLIMGTKLPTLVFPDYRENLNIELPTLCLYSLMRLSIFGRETETGSLEISFSQKGREYHFYLKYTGDSNSVPHGKSNRFEELLQLYKKYFGRRFSYFVSFGADECKIIWKP